MLDINILNNKNQLNGIWAAYMQNEVENNSNNDNDNDDDKEENDQINLFWGGM